MSLRLSLSLDISVQATLIEQILSGHSEVISLGEVDYFLRYFHQHNDDYWKLTQDKSNKNLLELANEYETLVSAMSQNSTRITDKRPENILFMGLIKKLFPKAKFIHTRRNLLDNAISMYFQQLNDLSKFSTSLESFANYDEQCERLMAHWKNLFGEDILQVTYESLVVEPLKIAQDMVEFINLDWQSECLDFSNRKNFVRTASVSQVRKKIYTSSVGRGRNYYSFFTDEEKQAYSRWLTN